MTVERLSVLVTDVDLAATEGERRAIASRLGIPAVVSLGCHWRLRRAPGTDMIEADGRLDAVVVQTCVASLEPFENPLREAFAVRFAPADALTEDDDPDSPDEIAFDGRTIDLGEATVEQLALALDPFPRAPDVAGASLAADTADQGGHPDEDHGGPAGKRPAFGALATRLKRS